MSKIFWVGVALWLTACGSHHMESDSKSNWLRECSEQKTCGDDLSCVCGLCTKRCDSVASCEAHGAVCIDPSREGIDSTCASAPAIKVVGICLQPCFRSSECGDGQRCMQGACVSEQALAADEGDSGNTDAGSSAAPNVGGKGGIKDTQDPAGTAGTASPAGTGGTSGTAGTGTSGTGGIGVIVDPPMDDDAGVEPPPPQCDVHGRPCCTSDTDCEDGDKVCHADRSCIAPGTFDEVGVATLSGAFYGHLYAADDEFAYGFVPAVGQDFGQGTLARVSLATGALETFADELRFDGWQSSPSPMVVDVDRIYFLAVADQTSLSASLWSMPKDGSAPPMAHGLGGKVLAQDAQDLFYSNDGDSRVLRVDKATLETSATPQEVFRSITDAPHSIAALAVNSSKLFAIELVFPADPSLQSTFNLHGVSKGSWMVEKLADSSKFTVNPQSSFGNSPGYEFPGRVFANDDYLVVGGAMAEDRLDLSTLEVKPLEGSSFNTAMQGGSLYGASSNVATDQGALWLVDLASAHRTYLLASFHVYPLRVVPVLGGVLVQTAKSPTSGVPSGLLRVVTQ